MEMDEDLKKILDSFDLDDGGQRDKHTKVLIDFHKCLEKTFVDLYNLDTNCPVEYLIMGFIELFESMVTSSIPNQIKVLKVLQKSVALLPADKGELPPNNTLSRAIFIISIGDFIKRAEEFIERREDNDENN